MTVRTREDMLRHVCSICGVTYISPGMDLLAKEQIGNEKRDREARAKADAEAAAKKIADAEALKLRVEEAEKTAGTDL